MKKYLIVGLGNIGEEYRHTRHNIGFLAVEHLAKQKEVEFTTVRLGDMALEAFYLYEPEWKSNQILVGKGKSTYRKPFGDCR